MAELTPSAFDRQRLRLSLGNGYGVRLAMPAAFNQDTSEQYANGWQLALVEVVNTALKILDGCEYREITRFGDEL